MLHKKRDRRHSVVSRLTSTKMEEQEDEDDGEKTLWERLHLRTVCVHFGLVIVCILYILLGSALFLFLERPMELLQREEALSRFDTLKKDFFSNASSSEVSAEKVVDDYLERLFILLEDPIYAHVFESHFTNYSTEKDLWTFQSAVLFTTTTVIPVGYGFIWPSTDLGRLLVIVYGIVGIPLALVTMADTGKFISQLVTGWFQDSITIPTILFLSLLFCYPIFGGFLFNYAADLSFLDAIYFSLTSIFTIGFGDLAPNINVVHLVLFLVFGVILVTITIDFVAAELIDHVHYMGRHVGKAKEIAGKMLQMAQSINMNRGISGLTAGMSQLQALARMGMLGKLDKEVLEKGQPVCAFAPALDDMDFMDRASIYAGKSEMDLSRHDDGKHLFL